MKQKALFKDIFREIKKTRSRFLSILLIVMLGVGFFAGIKSTCPDMKETAQKYFSEANLMDSHIKSSMGFTQGDIATLKSQPDIKYLEPGYTVDTFIAQEDDANIIARAYSYSSANKMNVPALKEGRLPQISGECLVEKNIMRGAEVKIGDSITLFLDEGEIKDSLLVTTFEVVGIVESPMYINFERGNTSLGNGTVNTFVYLPEAAFSYEVYTDVYASFESTSSVDFYSDDYTVLMDEKEQTLSALAAKREKTRHDEIYETALAEVNKSQVELDSGDAEYQANLALFNAQTNAASQKLKSAKLKLDSGNAELAKNEALLQTGVQEYEKAAATLAASQAEVAATRVKLAESSAKIGTITVAAGNARGVVSAYAGKSVPAGEALPADVTAVLADAPTLDVFTGGQFSFAQMLESYVRAEANSSEKASASQALTSALDEADMAITQGNEQSDAGYKQLAESQAQIDPVRAALDAKSVEIDASKKALSNARTELERGRAEYDSGMAQLQAEQSDGSAKLQDAAATIAQGRADLLDARHKLNDLPSPEWFIFDRTANPGYSNFVQDAERVDKIAAVFPVFFILVAALVCLTTMTRMVEEQRIQIGTLKALGYSKRATITKYMVYALSASFIGSALGLLVGFKLFPTVIFSAYKILYITPDILTPFRWDYAIICVVAAMACTGISAFAACASVLAESPCTLMRPKAPPSGKRVLLERFTPLWKQLSFLQKVTVRNLFRYKKRILMTVIGIAGCTALMLAGFGLRHAISSIVDKQYGTIFTYDALGVFDDKITPDELTEIRTQVAKEPKIASSMIARQGSVDASSDEPKQSVYLFVPENPAKMDEFIKLQHRKGAEAIPLEQSGVVITEKLSDLLDLDVGESITIKNGDFAPVDVKIADITENYTMNYIYMSPEQYAVSFGVDVPYNSFVAKMSDKAQENELSESLLKNNNILTINYSSEGGKSFRDIVKSMDAIVFVLIICAGALAFVVLYNLANINVEERLREIATIKVLGFFDLEVSAYIHRENTISALIGMAAGLALGVPFVKFIIATAEVDAVMFNPAMDFWSFVFAGALTFVFTLCVNVAMHFRLKKVDMVSSLKSIE